MGDVKGFLKVKRKSPQYRPVCERVKDYSEIIVLPKDKVSEEQASRCMDCGTPFCHWGCPVCNVIPEWNDFVFKGNWKKAWELLDSTNNLPEVTGRICPAVCEFACVLGINDDPVTIRENELSIVEYAFRHGWVKPHLPKKRTAKKVAVIGSGPAGLACADQLNKSGHKVTVFEKDAKLGGILRYGIPDFKLDKSILDRRLKILRKEGIKFLTKINAGKDYKVSKLKKEFDAICLAGGSRLPRDLKIEGRELKGVYFAMDYLIQANKRLNKEKILQEELIDTKGKRVVVIGGGDTGADCVGVAHRQGAACVLQIELLPKPETCRTDAYPWPKYPMLLKTSSSHEEGGERQWEISTKRFTGENGRLAKISCVKVDFSNKDDKGCPVMKEVAGSEFEVEADLVILALGFFSPEHNGLLNDLKVEFDGRGNVKTDENYMSSVKGVFSAGDMHRGQSLVVWAIHEGRSAAKAIDSYLE
ncbi:glutamate synthase subunit beta [bacterium]|nr:MAG: glutamate synthase subunit beta [bacterium]